MGPASEFMRLGLKTLLYLDGSETCFLLGDTVFPISNALSVAGAAGGGRPTELVFPSDAAEGPTCGVELL